MAPKEKTTKKGLIITNTGISKADIETRHHLYKRQNKTERKVT